MATNIGQPSEFDPQTESLLAYMERIQLFYRVNDIKAARQVPFLLSLIDSKNYSFLRDMMSPTLPQEAIFEDLVKVLEEHFQPQPLVIAETFKFCNSKQQSSQSVADFKAEVKKLASTYKFEGHLSEALRNLFVCGLRDHKT